MSIVVKHCDALLAKHHTRVSPIVLSVASLLVFGLISPTLLYAAEVTSSASNLSPAPLEFRPERPRILFGSSTPASMLASSTVPFREGAEREKGFSSSSTARVIQFKTARIQLMKEALAKIEQQARDLRIQLENLQYASTSSTEALNVGQFNQKINALILVFRKVNFNYELTRLKTDLKSEFNKRDLQLKKELQKEQAEAARELYKKQTELNRETLKKEQELLKEQREHNLPGAASTSPEQASASSTTSSP